jgi:hypothetical protein
MKAGILLVMITLVAAAQTKSRSIDFQKDIEPILSKNCVSCHQAAWAGGGLRLDSFEGLQHGGTSGKAVVPGNSQASLLVARMESSDTKCMPPKGQLTKEQIALVKTWITQGAKIPASAK